jgi:hypothetical protein
MEKLCSNCIMHNQCVMEKAMNGMACTFWADRLYGEAKRLLKEAVDEKGN